jgi:valyl-tRNA synthetase
MIMMGLKFTGRVPFSEVYITGLIRDQEGQKMSKSKGNILDPLDLIDGIDLEALVSKRTSGLMQPQMARRIEASTRKHFPQGIPAFGTDALRFTFAALASTGRDINFDLGRIEGYRNFCNKIWNAARFVLLNTDGQPVTTAAPDAPLSLPDRWIRSRLGKTIREVDQHLATYRLDLAARALYEFTWNEYCDWYLELTKPLLQEGAVSAAAQATVRGTLITVLETLLRALHPIVPFITEEIWQRVAPVAGVTGPTIMLQPAPDAAAFPADDAAEAELEWVRGFILGVRQIRGEMDISPAQALTVLLQDASRADEQRLHNQELYLRSIARLDSIRILDPAERAPTSAMALLGGMRLLVPMAGLIDVAAEQERLQKRVAKATAELQKVSAKLANSNFVERAPAAVVAQERERATHLEADIDQLQTQLQKLAELA